MLTITIRTFRFRLVVLSTRALRSHIPRTRSRRRRLDKKPPDPIPEEPAAEKPEGKNVQWIPGYWQWDTDKKDFIWISGMWRDIPAGRRWVMGYWANTNEGYRWVSGHFADANERDSQYVPEPPPENPDEGPTAPPPDDSSSYAGPADRLRPLLPGVGRRPNACPSARMKRAGERTKATAPLLSIPARPSP